MRFIVMTPRGTKSGGPEALHQLHFVLKTLGQDSFLLAAPGTNSNQVISEYDCYLPEYIAEKELVKSDVLIIPEYLDSIPMPIYRSVGRIVYWWLSVDNSSHFTNNANSVKVREVREKWLPVAVANNPLLDKAVNVPRKNLLRKIPTFVNSKRMIITNNINFKQIELSRVSHAFQSEYARKSLWETYKIKGLALSDYINDSHEIFNRSDGINKKALVAYNGIKGTELVQALEVLVKDEIDFLPLKGFNKEELSNIFAKSDLCLDLGHFPGKDRLPREALKAGCPILISKFGAGENEIDFRISEDYKLDLENLELENVADKLRQILSLGKETNLANQKFYRDYLLQDQADFITDVQKLIDSCSSGFSNTRMIVTRTKKI